MSDSLHLIHKTWINLQNHSFVIQFYNSCEAPHWHHFILITVQIFPKACMNDFAEKKNPKRVKLASRTSLGACMHLSICLNVTDNYLTISIGRNFTCGATGLPPKWKASCSALSWILSTYKGIWSSDCRGLADSCREIDVSITKRMFRGGKCSRYGGFQKQSLFQKACHCGTDHIWHFSRCFHSSSWQSLIYGATGGWMVNLKAMPWS